MLLHKFRVTGLTCAAALAPAWLLALPIAVAQTYDLTADWSDAQNPNGPWAYRAASNILPHVACWIPPFNGCQPAWAAASSGPGHIPAWFKSVGTPGAPLDMQPGDVIVHSDDPGSGGAGVANVAWTSPICGTVDVSGAVWLARNIGRANNWSLRHNNSVLASGIVTSTDPYSRANPYPLFLGACRSDALQGVTVAPGDRITLEFTRFAGSSGEFAGARLTIVAQPGDCCRPCDVNCDGSINGFDIESFVTALTGQSDPCSPCAADTSADGSVNGFDIQGFVECLSCG